MSVTHAGSRTRIFLSISLTSPGVRCPPLALPMSVTHSAGSLATPLPSLVSLVCIPSPSPFPLANDGLSHRDPPLCLRRAIPSLTPSPSHNVFPFSQPHPHVPSLSLLQQYGDGRRLDPRRRWPDPRGERPDPRAWTLDLCIPGLERRGSEDASPDLTGGDSWFSVSGPGQQAARRELSQSPFDDQGNR
jgi:hypothetical protein